MSAQEIIAELTKLSRRELEQVDATLHLLLRANGASTTPSAGEARGAGLIEQGGRKVLVAPPGAPPMTVETVKSILADFP